MAINMQFYFTFIKILHNASCCLDNNLWESCKSKTVCKESLIECE